MGRLSYVVAAALMASVHAHADTGPPTGIALAALVEGGRRLWPAVAVGAFVANLMHGAPPLKELAGEFHSYYNAERFLVDAAGLREARLALALAVRQVLRNGLANIGVSAPESM